MLSACLSTGIMLTLGTFCVAKLLCKLKNTQRYRIEVSQLNGITRKEKGRIGGEELTLDGNLKRRVYGGEVAIFGTLKFAYNYSITFFFLV